MKNYDYKDETKDVKGKVRHRQNLRFLASDGLNTYSLAQIFLTLTFSILD